MAASTALLSLNMLTMKKWFEGALLLVAVSVFSSCNGKGNEDPTPGGEGGKTESATLAQLLEKTGSSTTEFDIQVKEIVVTAVYENYVQLEDASSGAQLNKSGHGFTVGQTFSGRITGKARNNNGALVMSELVTSSAKQGTASALPCTTVSLSEVLANKAQYTNRRVKLENVTFVNGFNGSASGAGTFSQKGVQISAICRPAGITVPDGWQGDLICYPSAAACYVFGADDFSEHAIQTPLAVISNYGIYKNAEKNPTALRTYQKGKDQYAWSSDSNENEFRLQNYDEEWVVVLRFPKKYKLGQELTLTSETIGLSDVAEGSSTVFVEKVEGDKIWLMDYAADLGYICRINQK